MLRDAVCIYLKDALKTQAVKSPIMPGMKVSSFLTKYGTIPSMTGICPVAIGSHPTYEEKMVTPVSRHRTMVNTFNGMAKTVAL